MDAGLLEVSLQLSRVSWVSREHIEEGCTTEAARIASVLVVHLENLACRGHQLGHKDIMHKVGVKGPEDLSCSSYWR